MDLINTVTTLSLSIPFDRNSCPLVESPPGKCNCNYCHHWLSHRYRHSNRGWESRLKRERESSVSFCTGVGEILRESSLMLDVHGEVVVVVVDIRVRSLKEPKCYS